MTADAHATSDAHATAEHEDHGNTPAAWTAVAIIIVFVGATEVGLPLYGVIAGLGIGGLALGLAARPTLENLIGGFILYADRPVRVGEFCKFGDKLGLLRCQILRFTDVAAQIVKLPSRLRFGLHVAEIDEFPVSAPDGLLRPEAPRERFVRCGGVFALEVWEEVHAFQSGCGFSRMIWS